MADATEVTIADAIVAELEAASWSLPFAAERTWAPWREGADLLELKVGVLPVTMPTSTRFDRSGLFLFGFGIVIDFQQRVENDATGRPARAACDALSYVAEQVMDYYRDGHRIAGATNWAVAELERPQLFLQDRLWEEGVWETWLELTVKGCR